MLLLKKKSVFGSVWFLWIAESRSACDIVVVVGWLITIWPPSVFVV